MSKTAFYGTPPEERNEPTQVWCILHVESLKRVSSGEEPEEYWMNGMYTIYHKIILNNKFIHLHNFQKKVDYQIH